MTPGQLKARLSRLGMGPRDLAAARGMNVRTVQRILAGKQDVPMDMERWLDEYESRSL